MMFKHVTCSVALSLVLSYKSYIHLQARGSAERKARRENAPSKPSDVNVFSSIYLILPAALGLGVHSASVSTGSRKIFFWGVEHGR
jgi:hypothetical protein